MSKVTELFCILIRGFMLFCCISLDSCAIEWNQEDLFAIYDADALVAGRLLSYFVFSSMFVFMLCNNKIYSILFRTLHHESH